MKTKRNKKIVASTSAQPRATFNELMRRTKKIVNITRPTAGGTVTITLPVGADTYENVVVPHNLPESDIGNIQVLVNDKTIWDIKGGAAQLRALSDYYGEHILPNNTNSRALVFNFERLHMELPRQRKSFGLGTLDIQKLQIRFDIASNSTVDEPEVSAFAEVGPGTPLGLVRIIRTVPADYATNGIKDYINPFVVNKTNQAKVMAAHILKDDIKSVEIKRGSNIEVEAITKAQNNYKLEVAGRTPNNDWFSLDFCKQNFVEGAITYSDTTNSFITLRPDLASAGQMDMLVEYVGTLGSA